MELGPGQRVDRYEIEGLLGTGGLAAVYRVRHLDLDAPRAMKVLHVGSASRLERLRREGRLQARLRHPGIVQVTDVVSLPGGIGLVMELVEGCTLGTWLDERRPPLAERLRVFRAVVEAVGHAHDQGIVHRDLKPDNVLMSEDRGRWDPKVADFGLARLLEPDGPRSTRTGVSMGTPGYMAPEQIRDTARADHRADIFALGCILYRVVCEREAFSGSSPMETWSAILAERYVDPKEVLPTLPDPVAGAIRACLQGPPDARPASCPDLLAYLEGRGAPVVARSRAGDTLDLDALDGVAHSGPTLFDADEPDSLQTLEPEAPGTPRRRASVALWTVAAFGGAVALAIAAAVVVVVGWNLASEHEAPSHPEPPAEVAAPVEAAAPGQPASDLAPVEAPQPSTARAEPSRPAGAPPPSSEPSAPDTLSTGASASDAAAEAAPAEADPVEPAGDSALVQVSGEGDVTFVAAADGRRYPPGRLPPGRYGIDVRFGERKGAGFAFDLAAGEQAVVQCSSVNELCRKR